MNSSDYDWFRFWVHFIFGAILGALIGVAFCVQNWLTGIPGWLLVAGFSVGVAIPGGIFGDRFWEWFLRKLRWWW